MKRIFSVKCYWNDTRRMRRVYIEAKDENDAIHLIKESGGYSIRTIYEDFNHLPNKHQLMIAKRYNIEVNDLTRDELRKLIKDYEKK